MSMSKKFDWLGKAVAQGFEDGCNQSNQVVRNITVEMSDEPCNVDVAMLNDALRKLPFEKYVRLYRMMRTQVMALIENNECVLLDEEILKNKKFLNSPRS